MNEKAIHWYIIVNPAAGAVKKRWSKIKAFLESNEVKFDVATTAAKGDATQLCIAAISKGFRHIITVGGDGTNNEVVNGICQQTIVPSAEIYYSLLPVGTGNDWRKTHQIPIRLDPWLVALQQLKTKTQDIGQVNYIDENGKPAKRFFANVAGMAYDAFVVSETEKGKSTFSGKIYYLYMTLKCLFKYKLQEAEVVFGDQKVRDFFYTINVGICKYSGGGMQLVPHAIPDDGRLALTLAGPISKIGILLNTWRFYNGSLGKHSKVDTYFTERVQVFAKGEQAIGVEVDGEYLGQTPVEFVLLEKALTVVVPNT